MTIIQLEYLLAVANCGSFSQAAEHCFVTQPSLSMQIKALEEELGVVLLDRSKKPVIPTQAGEIVLAQARETITAYNYIKEAVAELRARRRASCGWASSRPSPPTCCTNSSPTSRATTRAWSWRSPKW